jgi:hypothetical protein
MTLDISDEITLELARLERAALARLRKRNSELQLGEAWRGLENADHDQARTGDRIRP